ncbi:hypothetical protein [Xylocopilactobacillus apis]|uniref:Uncharacterized protein n=1 Tax=Xylocopilactobacillus apis TaxID=2932183 RepID=A0AAU9DKX4_9LACO|nr:hypothetical protein [Xylocopilactobacillus apis]BDR57458.1 hypothetical protein KIMC2_20200 [Xylocopilactobacillus apis]BDR57507.1 hypothetical protein KIMC2_20690 [Xylocopilactobacillus apis]
MGYNVDGKMVPTYMRFYLENYKFMRWFTVSFETPTVTFSYEDGPGGEGVESRAEIDLEYNVNKSNKTGELIDDNYRFDEKQKQKLTHQQMREVLKPLKEAFNSLSDQKLTVDVLKRKAQSDLKTAPGTVSNIDEDN